MLAEEHSSFHGCYSSTVEITIPPVSVSVSTGIATTYCACAHIDVAILMALV